MSDHAPSPWVEVPIPPSANHLWRSVRTRKGVRVVKAKHYDRWLNEVVLTLRFGMDRAKAYPVRIVIEIFGGKGWSEDRRDASNGIKAIEDAIKHAERIIDDSTRYVSGVHADYFAPTVPGQVARCRVRIEHAGG